MQLDGDKRSVVKTNSGDALYAAEVDYEAWVRQRIREAARGMTTKQEPAHQSQPPVAIDTTTSNQAPSVFSLPVQSDQLFPSSRPYW